MDLVHAAPAKTEPNLLENDKRHEPQRDGNLHRTENGDLKVNVINSLVNYIYYTDNSDVVDAVYVPSG